MRRYPSGKRAARTTALLAVLCVLNFFDLGFTHTQLGRGNFAEANVIAATVAGTPGEIAVYKLTLFGLGAFILYRCRGHWESEAGVAALVVLYSGLMVWWTVYLESVEQCVSDVAVRAPQILF